MGDRIIDLQAWLRTPAGQYLLAWEQARLDEAVADLFGYHALQLGLGELDALRANRMPHRWLAVPKAGPQTDDLGSGPMNGAASRAAFVTDFSALPFGANSLDLVVMPHTLELGLDPHVCLREVERVLVPEGRVVICGLNPMSMWGWRQRADRALQRCGMDALFLPEAGELIAYWRLRDWLRLLSFEVETTQFGLYRPPVNRPGVLQRFAWMERAGERWWPILGAVYLLVAVKRVHGMRLIKPSWKTMPHRAVASSPVASRDTPFQGSARRNDHPKTERPD
jgi:SAM-dependent methyltransferase